MIKKEDKKAQTIIGVLFIIGLLAIILIIGFIMAIGGSVTKYVADNVVPELSGLGMVGSANLTEVSTYTIAPANSLIQSLSWITGVFYVLMLIGSIGIAFAMRGNANGWLIGFYFLLVVILIILSIFISNMYQDFYTSGGDYGDILKGYGLLSYMILYAPMIYAVIGFITGIILFSGRQEESYV
jgi:hypothetical protein